MSTGQQNLAEILDSRRALVVVGPGGVGKTTCSAAVAIGAAMRGRRVALLSIDPAKRLADALGLVIGDGMASVALPANVSGHLSAGLLDPKRIFDRMVKKYASSQEQARKILEHPLYRAASSNMSGPLEYMALARFAELIHDPSYDLVVLDTPPDTQALDFLARPNILAGFVENRVLGWLLKPFAYASNFGISAAFAIGEKLMGNIASVTGLKSLRMLSEFLVLMQDVIKGFHHASEGILKILADDSTGFVLVGSYSDASHRSLKVISQELQDLGYRTDALIINRTLPSSLFRELESHSHHLGETAVMDGSPKLLPSPLERRWRAEVDLQKQFRQLIGRPGNLPLVLQIPESLLPPQEIPQLLILSETLLSQRA